MARRNLVTNPSFRSSTQDASALPSIIYRPNHWAPFNGSSIEVVEGTTALPSFYGGEYMKVIKAAQASSGVETSTKIPVTVGLSYAASAYVRVPTGIDEAENATLTLKIRWLTSTGQYLAETSAESSTKTIEPSTTWTRLSTVGTAPVTATQAEIYIYQVPIGTINKVFHVDAVLFEQSEYVGGYLDNFSQTEENKYVNQALTPRQPLTIGGMELNADVTIGDLVLNTIDESGIVWVCTDIEGWWGHADPEIPDIPRGVEDGSYDVTGRYTARQLTLTGVFLPQNPDQVGAARDQLIAATNLVRTGAWLRTNEEPTRASYVRLSGRPTIQTVNARGRTEFSIGLRAADPVKYLWNDADPSNTGLTTVEIPGTSGVGTVSNIGTAEVTGIFEITGPAGVGTVISNTLNGEKITLVEALRGAGSIGNITKVELYSNVATITTEEDHQLIIGDVITVSGAGAPFDTSATSTTLVTKSSRTYPYTFSYEINSDIILDDIAPTNSFGSVSLANSDVLTIDTYERSVAFNGDITGNRSKVDTLVDWIKLTPGDNEIVFNDTIGEYTIINKQYDPTTGIATLTTQDSHFLSPGEILNVSLPETATINSKAITDGIVTLATTTNHGYSVGDIIDIQTVEVAQIVNKQISGNVATLTTAVDGGFAIGDEIVVDMATVKNIVAKSATSNTVTLTTPANHGYSVGDSVTVTLPYTGSVINKSLASNLATLVTAAAHDFSIGDNITVTMPVAATVIARTVSGSSVVLTTTSAHNFTVNDKVTVAFPTSAAVTGTRVYSGGPDYLMTLTTTAPHGFSVGDSITVSSGLTGAATVTNRSATTSACTLTFSANHNFVVNEEITVAGVGARYNGTFKITSVGSNTVTYAFTGAAESSTSSTGTVTNNTIASGYNGTKIVEAVTSTTISYLYYGPEDASSSTAIGATPVITNNTSLALNGVVTISAIPNATSFAYTKVS